MLTRPSPSIPSPIAAPVGDVRITFRSYLLPTGVVGLPGARAAATAGRYESDVTVSGGLNARFRGSTYPDDMDVKGRLVNGIYPLSLGFHKPGRPTAADLAVRTNGFRPVLVVNAGLAVPVTSNAAAKVTADGIHIHNGYRHWTAAKPMSEGCLMLAPDDWPPFISMFLKAFPKLSDWSTDGSRVGRRIGTVTVATTVYNDLVPSGRVQYA